MKLNNKLKAELRQLEEKAKESQSQKSPGSRSFDGKPNTSKLGLRSNRKEDSRQRSPRRLMLFQLNHNTVRASEALKVGDMEKLMLSDLKKGQHETLRVKKKVQIIEQMEKNQQLQGER